MVKFSHCDAVWSIDGYERFIARLYDIMPVIHKPGIPVSVMNCFLEHDPISGGLEPSQLTEIPFVLREAISLWESDDYDRMMAEELITGMERCVERNEDLLFNVS